MIFLFELLCTTVLGIAVLGMIAALIFVAVYLYNLLPAEAWGVTAAVLCLAAGVGFGVRRLLGDE